MEHSRVRACLIVNARASGGGLDVSEATTVLRARGWEVEVRTKRRKGDARELARRAAAEGFDPIVNCGGDGTMREIVDALTGTGVAVGVIPGGTANVWAHEIGVSSRPVVAARQLVGARRVRVDVGRIEINGKRPRHFLLMAGIGLDGAIMGRSSRRLKNRIGPLAVVVAAARVLPSFAPVAIRACLDGVRWEGRVTQLVLGNTRLYGGITEMTPGAYADDGLLDVCLITPAGPIASLRQAASLFLRRRPSEVGAEMYRSRVVTVETAGAVPLQLDGSAQPEKKKWRSRAMVYRFSVVPGGITMLVPPTYGGELLRDGLPPAFVARQEEE